MMTDLPALIEAARDDLAARLDLTGHVVFKEVPESDPTPGLVIEAADDFLSRDGATLSNEWRITFTVWVFVSAELDNADATTALNQMAGATLSSLGRGWAAVAVGKPAPYHVGGEWLAHGVPITVNTFIS